MASLAQLISTSGDWGKVWLAAHWDRKLKKQDYLEADVNALVESFLSRHSMLSLRATGHLLVGICKVLARKCALFEDDAAEVRTRLMLAFSGEGKQAENDDAAAAEANLVLLPKVDAEGAAGKQDPGTLLGGKRHIARLEDITLKVPTMVTEAEEPSDDIFGSMSLKELEAAMKGLPEVALPREDFVLDAGFDAMPLVQFGGADAFGADPFFAAGGDAARPELVPLESGTPMPLDMDLAPMDEDLVALDAPSPSRDFPEGPDDAAVPLAAELEAPLVEPESGSGAAGGGGGGGGDLVAKRRRRAYFACDEATEIPKETYQGFVNDRSAITRKTLLDYSVLLPHYAPSLPSFTTTFTEMCPALCEGILWGTQVAEKRRRLLQEAEVAEGSEFARRAELQPLAPADPIAAAAATAASAFVPLASPIEPGLAGLRSPDMPPDPQAALEQSLMTEQALLANAPVSMGGVVSVGGMDQEDQAESSAARVGYSVRTEKMHRFLAKEFQAKKKGSLSYENLCKAQATGRRELIAGCFFELLVLRTNGVIKLQQDEPLADIRITKAAQFQQ